MTARREPDAPYNFHQRVTEVASVDISAPYQLLYVVTAGTLVTFNQDGSTTDWGSPQAGALIPGPHYGVDDGSSAVVNGWKNEG
jgi:hypothetical protein